MRSPAVTMSLKTAAELGAFDIIAKVRAWCQALAIGDRSAASHQQPQGAGRFTVLLPLSKYFVTSEDGVSFCAMMSLLQDKVFMESWYELKDAILQEGIAFNRAHGTRAFEYPRLDSRFNKLFNEAMFNQSTILIKNILEFYKGFGNLKKPVDVGGGVEHVAGDMFESVPSRDAIFMKNCYKANPDNGKVIVVDAILPVIPDTSSSMKCAFLRDVIMMTQNPEGKERNQQEFLAMVTGEGFNGIRFDCCICNLWVMEFFKLNDMSFLV
ncbi:hypothetical protein TIFTF001_011970 [Ficus carica]|uniref:O-methyltransferase C-terminal domain-containing protein n=1 Tax=Ficus carica TaxID=3494 RepID=A0AA88D3A8_FICCA|nr:hypothetical protein TIFTF001_011970 [Ficus carica]